MVLTKQTHYVLYYLYDLDLAPYDLIAGSESSCRNRWMLKTPRTEWLARSQRARLKHGLYSAEARAEQKLVRGVQSRVESC
jgi:hypothetical protein